MSGSLGLGPHSIPVLVVAIDGRPRNHLLLQQVRSFGFSPEVVSAVNGSQLDIEALRRSYDLAGTTRLIGRSPTRAEIGCALSHKRCYQRGIILKSEWLVVLEDDVNLTSSFGHLPHVLTTMTSNRPRVVTFRAPAHCPVEWSSRRSIRHSTGGDTVVLARYFEPPSGTMGYAINASALAAGTRAERVLGLADWPPWGYECEYWCMYPWPVEDAGLGSVIGTRASASSSWPELNWLLSQRVIQTFRTFRPARVVLLASCLGGGLGWIRQVARPRLRSIFRGLRRRELVADPSAPTAR